MIYMENTHTKRMYAVDVLVGVPKESLAETKSPKNTYICHVYTYTHVHTQSVNSLK